MNKLIFLIITLLILLVPIAGAVVTIRPNILFKIKAEDTYFQFEKETNLNKIIVENGRIYFDNYWFSLKRGNITFKNFFENNINLTFDLQGDSGVTSTVNIYYLPASSRIKIRIAGVEQAEGTTWFYNPSNQTLTIKYTF